MKKRVLMIPAGIYITLVYLIAGIGAYTMIVLMFYLAILFPVWGIVWVISGFNFYKWLMSILYDDPYTEWATEFIIKQKKWTKIKE